MNRPTTTNEMEEVAKKHLMIEALRPPNASKLQMKLSHYMKLHIERQFLSCFGSLLCFMTMTLAHSGERARGLQRSQLFHKPGKQCLGNSCKAQENFKISHDSKVSMEGSSSCCTRAGTIPSAKGSGVLMICSDSYSFYDFQLRCHFPL